VTPRVLVAGETLVDFLPDSDVPLAAVDGFTRHPGGAPANVAVRLAQLEEPPWFWTRVGADPFGQFLVETLADRGVPDRFVERDPDAKTTLAFVSGADEESATVDDDPIGEVTEAADPRFTFYRDGTADTRLQPGRVPDETLETVEWVVLGGVLLASEPSRSAVFDLAERAGDRDCTVVFDPNGRPELWPDADFETQVRRLLPLVDVVKTTPEDLTPAGFAADPDELASELHDVGVHTVFRTAGDAGSAVSASDDAPWGPTRASHAGYEVDAVDTTGAGDAFTAGVVAALADGERDMEQTLARANAVAAASTTRRGGMSELPDPTTVTDSER
jgi:fructokinase